MSERFRYPDEDALTDFFGRPPTPGDEYEQYYEVTDARGVTLVFSFDPVLASVQTALSVSGVTVTTIVQEGAELLSLAKGALLGTFRYGGAFASLSIRSHPEIHVHWATLISGDTK